MEVSGRELNELDDSVAGSKSFYGLICEPCNRDEGKHLKAVAYCVGCEYYFCQACVKFHKRLGLNDHVLLEGDEMPKTKPAKRKGKAVKLEEEDTDMCEKHSGKLVTHFCPDHKFVGCMYCITLGHKSCTGAQLISDISRQKGAKQLCDSFKNKLQALAANIDGCLKESTINKEEADRQYHMALSILKKYKLEIIVALDDLENAIEKEARMQRETDMKIMDGLSVSCRTLTKNISDVVAEFDALQAGNKNSKLFTLVYRAKSQLEDWEKQSKGLDMKNRIQRYTFEPECLIRDMLQNPEGRLGKLIRNQDIKKQPGDESAQSKTIAENNGQNQEAHNKLDPNQATNKQAEDVSARSKAPCVNKGGSGWLCPKCSSLSQKVELACGHALCRDCAREQVNHNKPCIDCGVITGSQPRGSLDTSHYLSRWIKVIFKFPDGIQMPHHPQPGHHYHGRTMVCYLFDDDKGLSTLKLLKIAFERRLISKLQDGIVCDNVGMFDKDPWNYSNLWNRTWWDMNYHGWNSSITRRLAHLGIRA